MSRIEAVEIEEQLPAGAVEVLEFAERAGAPDPRMARVLVRCEAGVRFLQYWTAALYEGLLPHKLKEIVRIYLSASEGCAYCSTVRSSLGAEEGVSDDLLLSLDDLDTSALISERERAALRFARLMKLGQADYDQTFTDLSAHFSQDEIIELGIFCGIVLGAGSFAKLLKVVTWDEVCSLNPNMARLRAIGAKVSNLSGAELPGGGE